MFLIINDDEKIECSKVEKINDSIKVYDDNNNLFHSFIGVTDFSKFKVEGGEIETVVDDITQIQLAIAELAEAINNG